MKNKHIIQLSEREEQQLQDIITCGTHNARVIARAHILLKSHKGYTDEVIVEHIGASRRTVQRTRKRYHEGGLERTLYDAPRPGAPTKLCARAEAYLVALACSNAPEGRDHWTLEMLQERLVQDSVVSSISTVAIWYHLKDRGIKPWQEKNVVHSRDKRPIS
jgi:transposase